MVGKIYCDKGKVMSLASDVKKYRICDTKYLYDDVNEHYSAKSLIAQLQESLRKFEKDDASLDAVYNEYDNPPRFRGFRLAVSVKKTNKELQDEVDARKQSEEEKKKRDYEQYLKLKEQFKDS